MLNIVQAVCAANAGRDPRGLRLKLHKLRQDPFAFLRGTCQRYYQAMPEPDWTGGAPVGWVCGDLHLENFGAYLGRQGKVCVDINDFDAAQRAPLSWDVLRLLSSLRLACRERGWGHDVQDAAGQRFVAMYARALAAAQNTLPRPPCVSLPLANLQNHAQRRGQARQHMLALIHEPEGKPRLKVDGERLLAIPRRLRDDVERLLDQVAVRQAGWTGLRVKDAALRLAGTGSLGLPRYLVLVKTDGDPGCQLLDLKLATSPGCLATAQPAWPSEAMRIVTQQQRLQARPERGLAALADGPRSWTLRPWQPPDLGLRATQVLARADDLIPLLSDLANITAGAHRRGAGQDGAAGAQDMAATAAEHAATWPAAWLHAERQATAQLERDWRAYARAYDRGAFMSLLQDD